MRRAGQWKDPIRELARRAGYEVRKRERTVAGRRNQLLAYHEIDLLVDVGANVGQYAQMIQLHGYRGGILSLEPLLEPYRQLEVASARHSQWDAVRTAVGATSGTVTLNVSADSVFSSALPTLEAAHRASTETRSVRQEVVPLRTLDEIVGDSGSSVAVKIDVQGFERDVLEGAAVTLARAKVLEMELSPRPLYDGQMLMDEALSHMDQAGFVLALVENAWRMHESGRSLQFNGVFMRE